MDVYGPSNDGRVLAYVISTVTTLLWVACVLPSGVLGVDVNEDLGTPLHREKTLLVPALVLLVLSPAGLVLSRTRQGLLALLSATDAFIAFYSAVTLTWLGAFGTPTSGVLTGVLYGLGLLSVVEAVRLLLGGREVRVPALRGVRLAVCLMALLTPSFFLVQSGRELASLLAPFALLTISTGGAILARTSLGLKRTAALLYVAIAVHVFVTLRYTVFAADSDLRPAFVSINPFGWTMLGLSVLLLLLTFVQLVRLIRLGRRSPAPAAASSMAP